MTVFRNILGGLPPGRRKYVALGDEVWGPNDLDLGDVELR